MNTTTKIPSKAPAIEISNRDIFLYFWNHNINQKGKFLLVILTEMTVIGCGILIPKMYSKIVEVANNTELLSGEIASALSGIVGIICLLEVIKLFVDFLGEIIFWKVIIQVRTVLTKDIMYYTLGHSYTFFANNFSGSLLAKNKKFLGAERDFMRIFFKIFNTIVFVTGILAIVFSESWQIGLCFLAFTIAYCITAYLIFKKEQVREEKRQELQSQASAILSDTITNNMNVLTFASHQKELDHYDKKMQERQTCFEKRDFIHQQHTFIIRIVTYLFRWLIFFLSLRFRKNGELSPAIVLLAFTYVQQLDWKLEIVWILKMINHFIGATKEMLKILNTPHEIVDKTEKKLKVWAWKIEFQDLTFGYSKDVKVFEHFDLRIKPWEKIALVGQSGSGKSSLTKLLFRFYDLFDGKITIDDQDISEVTQESLRSQISLVPQEVILFHRSLKENICYGNPKATEEEMISACKMARCYDFISKLEQGFDTLVGERGIKLSWWERQRVAIARAILENKKILVLDEATSALDSESEVLIQEAMEEVMKNKTCIVIAHRLSTIRKMDKIIVMEKGKIIEKGSHNELLNLDGTYARLWNLQSDGFLGEE